jgi:hypothetical protein
MEGKDRGEFVIPIILIALSIFLYINTYTFKFTTYQKANPQMWPRGILVLIVLTSLLLIGKLLFAKSKEAAKKEKEKPKIVWSKMLKGILILLLYIALMKYLGYLASTLLFTAAAMFLLGNRNRVQLVVVPILTAAFIFLIFTYAMYIPLPKGVWIFRTFSLMFQ